MSGFLDHLVGRTLGTIPSLQPRPRALFEPSPTVSADFSEVAEVRHPDPARQPDLPTPRAVDAAAHPQPGPQTGDGPYLSGQSVDRPGWARPGTDRPGTADSCLVDIEDSRVVDVFSVGQPPGADGSVVYQTAEDRPGIDRSIVAVAGAVGTRSGGVSQNWIATVRPVAAGPLLSGRPGPAAKSLVRHHRAVPTPDLQLEASRGGRHGPAEAAPPEPESTQPLTADLSHDARRAADHHAWTAAVPSTAGTAVEGTPEQVDRHGQLAEQRHEHPDGSARHPGGDPDAAPTRGPRAGTSVTQSAAGTLDPSTEVPLSTPASKPGPWTQSGSPEVEQSATLSERVARNVPRRSRSAPAVESAAVAPAAQAEGTGDAGEEFGLARATRQVPDHTVRSEEAPSRQSPVTGVVERRPDPVTLTERPGAAAPARSAARVEQSPNVLANPAPVTTAGPTVTVHIGRVVAAAPVLAPPVVAPLGASSPSAAPHISPLSLEDYLHHRAGGST